MKRSLEAIYANTTRQDNGCRVWLLSNNGCGHPQANIGGRATLVRRVVAELAGMQIDGRRVVMTCSSPKCVAHEHMGTETKAAGMARMTEIAKHLPSRLAASKAALHNRAKLTIQQALTIKISAAPRAELAKRFGVHVSTVRQIQEGRLWKDAKITQIPCPPGRYEPSPGFERAITSDWLARRRGGETT